MGCVKNIYSLISYMLLLVLGIKQHNVKSSFYMTHCL